MKLLFAALALAAALRAQEAAPPQTLQPLYDEAFKFYQAGDFGRAIAKWEEVLKLDPKQSTAQKMIPMAREQIAQREKAAQEKLGGLIRQGKFRDARLELQAFLDKDPGNPVYVALQSKLEKVSEICTQAPSKKKPWRMAVQGLAAYMEAPPKIQLAYDSLRYAKELAPKERRFERFIELFLESHPEAAEDSTTPGMKLIDYKLFVSLQHIYDGKHHLAVKELEQVLSLEPKNLVALKRLGSAYFALGRYEKAREAWKRARRLAPKDAQLTEFLASVDKKTRPTRRRRSAK